ncbi:MAG: biosis protein MshL [Candidatus Sumerlaeota bacterium]|nr:biosis protein MshL [Candidatus Sumerlaeota bacterium]
MRMRMAGLAALSMAGLLAVPVAAQQDADWKAKLDAKPDEIEAHVVRILRTTNKAQINRYVSKVYDFEHVNPGQINNFFHSALFREEGAAYTFTAEDGESGKIMVICPEYQLEYFDELARELDRPKLTSAPGSTYLYKQLKHRSANDAEFINIARQYASANSVVRGDVETNALFIFDSPWGAEYLANTLDAYLDTPTPVIDTHVRLYEIDLNNDGTVGLDYEDYKNGPYQNAFVGVVSGSALSASASANNGEANTGTYNQFLQLDVQYPSAFFDFLIEKGKARMVTDTHLVTSSQQPATLFTGDQILYYRRTTDNFDPALGRTVTGTATDLEVLSDTGNPLIHDAGGVLVEAQDAGIRLNLTPLASREVMQIDVEVSVVSLMGFTESSPAGGGQPILNTRRANTCVSVKNGEEVVLGGLVRERRARTTYRVPILGKLPVIGWLFGGETEITQKSMLVAVLQPTLDETSFRNVTPSDAAVMATVKGETEPILPEAAYAFDMYLLDSE